MPARGVNQRGDPGSQAGDQGAGNVRGRALPFVQLVGSVRLTVDRAPGRQRHEAPASRRSNPGRQIHIHPPELLNEEFAATGRAAVTRHHTADTVASHAVDDEALAAQRNDQIRVQSEMAQRNFDANRLWKVGKRKERNRLRPRHDSAVRRLVVVVQHQADCVLRVSAVPADIVFHYAIFVETYPLNRDGTDIPALKNRAGETFPAAGSPVHFHTPTSVFRIHPPYAI